MYRLLILSGKGGTGKTTIAAAFISYLNAKAFADCDVDAPNLHLLKHMNNPEVKNYTGSDKAYIDEDKCIKCGECLKACKFDAIDLKENRYTINQYKCEGCGVCSYVCKTDAAKLYKDTAGETYLYKNNNIYFSTAKLKMGRGNSGKLVSEVKSNLPDLKDNIAVIDGSPGIGCPVIASVSGVNLVLIVTEPTLSGLSDLKRIIDTTDHFNTKSVVCINKADTSLKISETIKAYCSKNDIICTGEIPYDKNVSAALNKGVCIADIKCSASDAIYKVYKQVMDIIKEDMSC